MARLIDAELLIKDLLKIKEKTKSSGNEVIFSLNDVLTLLNGLPTAYDVEKVVEELEGLPLHYCEGHWGDYIDQEDAIEIVRKGGVDDNNNQL